MEELKENISYKDVELLSEEAQEVMSRIPSAIVRWGMTLMAIIVAGLIIAAIYLPWPHSKEYAFEGTLDGAKAIIFVTLPAETIKYISKTNGRYGVTLYSPLFSDDYSESGISGIINDISLGNKYGEGYKAKLDIELSDIIYNDTIHLCTGNIFIITSEATLFQRMLERHQIYK